MSLRHEYCICTAERPQAQPAFDAVIHIATGEDPNSR